MTDVPAWVLVLQALLTPAIALAVGVVAFLQWRTAHQKVVLDLFDRRMAVYLKIREAVALISGSGRVTDQSDRLLLEAENEAAFLFGRDIQAYLRNLWFLCCSYRAQQPGDGKAGPHYLETNRELMQVVSEFYEDGADLFAPYMRMDQKRIPTPREFLSERNRIRLSYADEKQR